MDVALLEDHQTNRRQSSLQGLSFGLNVLRAPQVSGPLLHEPQLL